MKVQTTRRGIMRENLRALPPHERAKALRVLLRDRFGHKPGITGFRNPIKRQAFKSNHEVSS